MARPPLFGYSNRVMSITTIVPTLNEERTIGPLLERLRGLGAGEVVVVDGGSDDRTVEAARGRRARVLIEPGGLVRQLNRGAAEASGEILFFLPADTTLTFDPFPLIAGALKRPHVVAGGFDLDYGERLRWRLLSWGANRRAHMMGLPMGDQGIFIRRESFDRVRGFRQGTLLPDLDLVIRARHYGRIVLLPQRLRTSPRRYEQQGLARNWLSNQALFWTQILQAEQAPPWARRLLAGLRQGRRG